MTITASMVKELREKSGAGMMDCKKALSETEGDFEAAVDWLRKKGLSVAAKKSGRIAAEGLIGVALSDQKGVLLEVNAETDFVARNPQFQQFVLSLSKIGLEHSDSVDALMAANFEDKTHSVSDELTNQIATIGENISIRRVQAVSLGSGVVSGYIHGSAEGSGGKLGRIGVLVGLETEVDNLEEVQNLGRQIAMHIAAARPQFLTVEEISEADLERERKILTEQALAEGRPPEIVEKMVTGRMRKFHAEVVLLEQTFIMDNETKIADLLKNKGKELGGSIQLAGFLCYALGEGIERKQDDFAAEVAAAAKG